jgi:hypothetical protein
VKQSISPAIGSAIGSTISSTNRALLFSRCIVALGLALGLTVSTIAKAGECKVKSPSDGTIADAMKMQIMTELQIERLANEYKAQTGKELKVILVSRAGQNFNELQVLKDLDSNGNILSPQRIVELAQADFPWGSQPEYELVHLKALDLFADHQRPMKYSHMGVLLRHHPAGRDLNGNQEFWWFRHQLRPCVDEKKKQDGLDYNKPLLWDEGMGRFFSDDPHELRAQLVVLKPEIQDRVEALVLNNRSALAFNGNYYNAVANWQNTNEQNSNQWVVEILAAALQPIGKITSRAQAQQVLLTTGYRPTTIAFWGKQRLALLPGAGRLLPYVQIHALENPYAHLYRIGQVISTMSIVEYLARQNVLQWAPIEVHIAGGTSRNTKRKAQE